MAETDNEIKPEPLDDRISNNAKTTPAVNNQAINLKVMGQDGVVIQFKLKKTSQFKKLMHAYCDRVGLNIKEIRFMFDGTHIHETTTPGELDMEEDDTIEVMMEQLGGR